MEIEGRIERIFCIKDNWASVLLTDVPEQTLLAAGFPISKKVIQACGNIIKPVVGTVMNFTGDWKRDSKWGIQFKVDYCSLNKTDYDTILSYLSSDFIEGVGEKTAKKIVDKFDTKTFEIIEKDHMRLTEISGISPAKANVIHLNYMDTKVFIDIMELFHGDISKNKVTKIYEMYKNDSVNVIKNNPYQLIYDIRGFGFLTVDKLALSTGIKLDDPRRVKASIVYTLDQIAQNNGHCYINVEDLAANIQSLIKNMQVDDNVIADQIVELQKDGYLYCEPVQYTTRIYLKDLYNTENQLAKKISNMKKEGTSLFYDKDRIMGAINNIEATDNIVFENLQIDAVLRSLKNHISIITGGPGTGKSTIINALVKAATILGLDVVLVAPTGRASRRLHEATGRDALTISKFNFIYNNSKALSGNYLFVVDEASMVDVEMANNFFKHIKTTDIAVLVGDTDQLPSIGPGNFFRDLVKSRIVPLTKLQITHRFSGCIAKNAAAINNGNCKLTEGNDFKVINVSDSKKRQEIVLQEYYKELAAVKGDYRKIQIIVPMRQKGDTSANVLNDIIREKVNPASSHSLKFSKKGFRVGDRVMQIKNNQKLEVANGDCGIVTRVTADYMEVMMDVGGIKQYDTETSDELVIAYAITVHKSQGSEYMVVISAYGSSDYMMLQRNLLYTAVTRAKKKMIMIADNKSIWRAVNNIQPIVRNTSLIERIQHFDSL